MPGFKNASIYVHGRGIIKTDLAYENGIITKIGRINDPSLISLNDDEIVVPGFIDEHIHGCSGHDVMEASLEGLQTIADSLLKEGVTAFCPTTMSMSEKEINAALKTIATFKAKQTSGATILGAHVEGPFLSTHFHGAQDEKYLLDCNKDVLNEFITSAENQIRILTFAPERKGEQILPLLLEHKITPSLGHSNASGDEAKAAFEQGASCLTHCYNAMRGLHHRDVGLLGAGLLNDQVYAELIADLKHVSPDAIRLLFKVKGKEKIVLVSDSMEAKYLPEGNYELGGQKVIVKDNAARLENGVLAGSVLRLDHALKNIHEVMPDLTLTDLIDLVTLNPAKNLGLTNRGAIKVGHVASFTIIRKDFSVVKAIV